MKSIIKPKEGDVFAVPLRHGDFGIGLLTHKHKSITLGYFFNLVYDTIPSNVEASMFDRSNVVLIGKFSSLGIESGEWQLLKTSYQFKKEDWNIPTFKMQNPLTEKYFAVVYDETLINEDRYLITEEEARLLFSHGLYGYGALEKKLSSILGDLN